MIRGSVASFERLCGRRTFLKMRHHCDVLWPQIASAVPNVRIVFMLRNRMDWALSRHRVFGDGPETLVTVLREGMINLDAMIRAGLSVQIVWYEDLIADPLSTLRRLEIESDGRGALDPICWRRRWKRIASGIEPCAKQREAAADRGELPSCIRRPVGTDSAV